MRCAFLACLFAGCFSFLPGAVHSGLRYASRPDALLDLITPVGQAPSLAILAVHGGGWSSGSRSDALPFCRAMVSAGYACAVMDYRLAPANRLAAQLEDVWSATAFLHRKAAQFHLRPDGIVLAGESAGGHLVALAGSLRDEKAAIAGVIAFSAPLNLEALSEPGRALGVLPPELRDLLGITGWTEANTKVLRSASPGLNISSGMPPALLIHGTADRLVPLDQSRSYCAGFAVEGNPCEVVPVAGALHGLWKEDQFEKWSPLWQPAVIRWLGALSTGNTGIKNH